MCLFSDKDDSLNDVPVLCVNKHAEIDALEADMDFSRIHLQLDKELDLDSEFILVWHQVVSQRQQVYDSCRQVCNSL
jgi:hypothetical protein